MATFFAAISFSLKYFDALPFITRKLRPLISWVSALTDMRLLSRRGGKLWALLGTHRHVDALLCGTRSRTRLWECGGAWRPAAPGGRKGTGDA